VVRDAGRHHAGLSGHGPLILCHDGRVWWEFGPSIRALTPICPNISLASRLNPLRTSVSSTIT
jgi:hypothetical protein